MPKKKKLLFVCVGNTCRSPMIAAYCNLKYEGILADSAGISTDGSDMNEKSKTALLHYGIDVSSLPEHRSKAVSSELVDGADKIICADTSICALLRFYFPHARSKISCFSPSVPDPFGGSVQDYIDCLEFMINQIDTFIE